MKYNFGLPNVNRRTLHANRTPDELKAVALRRLVGQYGSGHASGPGPESFLGNFWVLRLRDEKEAIRLQYAIKQPMRWSIEICKSLAPLTLEINRLKKEKDVFLIAHSYQTPDITYGVADSVADSYALSKEARDAPQQTILFSSVRFMAETAKIVSPEKTVFASISRCRLLTE